MKSNTSKKAVMSAILVVVTVLLLRHSGLSNNITDILTIILVVVEIFTVNYVYDKIKRTK